MLKKLGTIPYYIFLLPVFFVLHGYLNNYGFVEPLDAAWLLFTYTLAAGVIFLLSYAVLKTAAKAGMMTFTLLAIYFFFGAFQDFLALHSIFKIFLKYSILLPILFAAVVGVAILLKRMMQPFPTAQVFLNVLLLIYIGIDAGLITTKYIRPPKDRLKVYFERQLSYRTPQVQQTKPDIFLLLFDEYGSTATLKDLGYDNSSLDSLLVRNGFHIQRHSRSNYCITTFSMASMLNMSYLGGLNKQKLSAKDYARCNKLIRNNEVIQLLSANGYCIENYSVFDLAGHPSIVNQSLLPLKTRLITESTLGGRMERDLGWQLYTGMFRWIPKLFGNLLHDQEKNNERLIQLTKSNSRPEGDKPRFVYTHLYLPHFPYYRNKHLEKNSDAELERETHGSGLTGYLGYLPYTNQQLEQLVLTIRNNNPGAVILIMSDHGYREPAYPGFPDPYFRNLNAVYFPSGDYSKLYDSISSVNQFRVIFNTIFHMQIPLVKDSCVLLPFDR